MSAPTTVRWLDRLAHDLRGPLTPLQTAAYLLRSGQVDGERQQELFIVIERQSRQLVRMIDELGDWSRAANTRLLGHSEPCEISLLLEYALTGAAADAATTVDNRATAAVVQGDPVRLTQLLRTLIEYVDSRSDSPVRITLHATGHHLCVDVRGSPAPDPAQLAIMLEEPQAEPYDEGLGLRLLLARAIAEIHGGGLMAMADEGCLLLRCELPLVMG